MGAVVLDAGVLIGFSNPNDAHHQAVVDEMRRAAAVGHSFCVPASALSEYLVIPARGGAATVTQALGIVRRLPADVVPLDENVATDAALIRAQHPALRLPDALVIATARVHAADVLVTTDRRWPTKRALRFAGKIVVL